MSTKADSSSYQAPPAASSTQFQCIACLEMHSAKPVIVHQDTMCADCFKSSVFLDFEAALKSGMHATYRNVELNINDFRDFFSVEFLAQWAAKQAERGTLPGYRVYCSSHKCAHFICSKVAVTTNPVCCTACGRSTCIKCAGRVSGDLEDHECVFPDDEAYHGLERGKHFQHCYRCGISGELRDGCNHITCVCSAEYCFLCGEPATENSGHWTASGCPRFGRPDQVNPVTVPDAQGARFNAEVTQRRLRGISEALRRMASGLRGRRVGPFVEEDPEYWRPHLAAFSHTAECQLALRHHGALMFTTNLLRRIAQSPMRLNSNNISALLDFAVALQDHHVLVAYIAPLIIINGRQLSEHYWRWIGENGRTEALFRLREALPADIAPQYRGLLDIFTTMSVASMQDGRQLRPWCRELLRRPEGAAVGGPQTWRDSVGGSRRVVQDGSQARFRRA